MSLARLIHLLAFLALMLAPAGMLGSHAAMAMPQEPAASASMGHCDMGEQAPDGQQKQRMIDCAIACSAMPSSAPTVAREPYAAPLPYRMAAAADIEGMRPEAATPPPRAI